MTWWSVREKFCLLCCDTDGIVTYYNSRIILPVSLLSLNKRISPISLLAAVMQERHPKILEFLGGSFLTDDTKMQMFF